MGATFATVSGKKLTLGEIKPNENFSEQDDLITILNAIGGTKGQYLYVNEQTVADIKIDPGYDTDPGWYDAAAWGAWEWDCEPPPCQNAVELERGEALMLKPGTKSGGLVFSGEVDAEDIEFKAKNTTDKLFRSNCTPVNLTLGDIKPNLLFSEQDDMITLLNTIGGTKGQYLYVSEQTVEEIKVDPGYDTPAGWYEASAWSAWEWDCEPPPCQNEIKLNASAGFVLKPGKVDGGVIVPSAL